MKENNEKKMYFCKKNFAANLLIQKIINYNCNKRYNLHYTRIVMFEF